MTGLSEFELIDRFFAQPARRHRADVVLGIGDDAALVQVPDGSELVATTDTLVAGSHFLLDAPARSVGHRALAVNLSDVAAMGATPAWALLALTLERADSEWLAEFSSGWFELADRHDVALVGGNTSRGSLNVNVTLLGHAPRAAALRRSGARPGDLLVVTGTLGDSGAGFELARTRPARATLTSDERALLARFEYPSARVQFGIAARGIASAAMDLSDGLAGDLPKLAAASGLAAHVEVERLPMSVHLRNVASIAQAREWALGAGDDYELLLAVEPTRLDDLARAAQRTDLPLTMIGKLSMGEGVTWSMQGEPIEPRLQGYDHFRAARDT